MKLAPEGLPFVTAAFGMLGALVILALLRGGGWTLAAVLWAPAALWVVAFFRDPTRSGPRGDDLLLAPADGRIVSVLAVEEPDYIRGPAIRISVFMNVFSVHVNRYPASGDVEYRAYREGKFFNATLDKASEYNEQMSLGIRAAGGPILVRQIAGLIARRIVTDDLVGASVKQGERLGIIRFGSRVDLFVPASTRVLVTVGERARAGITVLAEWSR